MARDFAKKFYNSKQWKDTREYIFNKYYGLCADCGKPGEEVHHIEWLKPANINDPNITIGEDNLILLCKDCHFNKHKESNPLAKNFKKKKKLTNCGTYFDEEGNFCECKTYIVYGAPASGKSTYVKEHKKEGDLVVDLDLIMQAISMEDKSNIPDNLLDVAIGIRDYIYKRIEDKTVDSKNIWVIGTLPNKKQREELMIRLNAEMIFISATIDECISRANKDPDRKDKALQEAIIENWFAKYQA